MNLYYVYIFVPIYLVTNNEYLPIHITNHNHNLSSTSTSCVHALPSAPRPADCFCAALGRPIPSAALALQARGGTGGRGARAARCRVLHQAAWSVPRFRFSFRFSCLPPDHRRVRTFSRARTFRSSPRTGHETHPVLSPAQACSGAILRCTWSTELTSECAWPTNRTAQVPGVHKAGPSLGRGGGRVRVRLRSVRGVAAEGEAPFSPGGTRLTGAAAAAPTPIAPMLPPPPTPRPHPPGPAVYSPPPFFFFFPLNSRLLTREIRAFFLLVVNDESVELRRL